MIRRLRARRDDNDPRRMPHYGYSQYERMMFGFSNLDNLATKPEERQWIDEYADTSLLTTEMLALTVLLGQVFVSALWLHCCQFGPLEWLWRMLTYGRRMPLLKERD